MKALWEQRVFCAVVENKSFVAAARQLGASPSGVTRAVQALEGALGCALLMRSSKQLGLTPAGENYYEAARRMLELQQDAEDSLAALAESPRGLVRFSAPEALASHFLPAVLAQLATDNPELRFDVLYSDTILEPIREKLDFSIRGAFPASSELIGYPLWPYRRHLYASPDYARRHGLAQQPEELPRHRVILHSAPRVLKAWNFVSEERSVSLNLSGWHRAGSGLAVLAAAQAGLGCARLGDWLAEPLAARGELLRLCPDYRIVSSKGDDPLMHAVIAGPRIPHKTRVVLEAIRQAAQRAGLTGQQ